MMMWCLFMIFLLNPECDTLRSAEQFKCEWREVQFIKTQGIVAPTCVTVHQVHCKAGELPAVHIMLESPIKVCPHQLCHFHMLENAKNVPDMRV